MDEQEDLPKDMLEQVSCQAAFKAQVILLAAKRMLGESAVANRSSSHL